MTAIDEVPASPVAPVSMLEGSFALFKHDGGFLIAWRKKGEDHSRHLPIPAFVLQMAAQASGRTIDDMIAELAGFGEDL